MPLGGRGIGILHRRHDRDCAKRTSHMGLARVARFCGKVGQGRTLACAHLHEDTPEPPDAGACLRGQPHPFGECAGELALAETRLSRNLFDACQSIEPPRAWATSRWIAGTRGSLDDRISSNRQAVGEV